jgi:dipeptidyl-peptidase-4
MKHKSLVLLIPMLALALSVSAQDKLKTMPGYSQYQKVAPQIRNSVKSGSISGKWSADGSSFEYQQDKKIYRYIVKTKKITEVGPAPEVEPRNFNRPARGNSTWKVYTRDRNMYLSKADGSNEMVITKDANEQNQIKYGIATWVYGEELGQNTAMWWSPDSKKVAFYKFDEKDAKKFYVLLNQLKLQDSLEIEAYPKVGAA